jgi:hypothetical protein
MDTEIRRQFFAQGAVNPRAWPDGPSQLRAECLIEGADPQIEVTVRFAQAIERRVLDAGGDRVAELTVTGRRYAGGEELEEREVTLSSLPNRKAAIETAGGRRAELRENGAPAGALAWSWEPLHGTVEAWVEEIGPGLRRVRVEIANRLEWAGEPAARIRLRSLHATHLLLHSPDGAFASLAHPPAHLRGHAAGCHNDGLWPTPVGQAGDRRTVLAAPVRLEDYPGVGTDPQIGIAA